MAFNLKAKGDEMKIGCSTIGESESTGTDLLVRVKQGGGGASRRMPADHLPGAEACAGPWGHCDNGGGHRPWPQGASIR